MPPDTVLHERTRALLDRLQQRPVHALALIAPEGAGKRTVADMIAARLLATTPDALPRQAGYRLVTPEKTSIPIEALRDLQQFGKLKAFGRGAVQRVALIEQAHLMGSEAQNAALKLLEEPPAGMVLLLTAANEQALLPTIRSRLQIERLLPPVPAELSRHFTAAGHDTTTVDRAVLVSGGLPGLSHALLHETGHPMAQAVEQARSLLRATTLEKLGYVDTIGKSRDDSRHLCAVLRRMAQTALGVAAAKQAPVATLRQWHRVLAAAYETEDALRRNAQPKLALTHLMLRL